MIRLATVFSGISAPEQALKRIGVPYEIVFACDNGERMIDVDYDAEMTKIREMNSVEEKRRYVDNLYAQKTRRTNFVKIYGAWFCRFRSRGECGSSLVYSGGTWSKNHGTKSDRGMVPFGIVGSYAF